MFGYSMIGHRRLENIQLCLQSVTSAGIDGDFVECEFGGAVPILAQAVLNGLETRTERYGFLPTASRMPIQQLEDKIDRDLILDAGAYLRVSMEEVRQNFARFGLLDDNVIFIKGWFSETLQKAPITRIAVLRLDGDYYSSTIDILEGLYDRVSKGGYITSMTTTLSPCRKAITVFCDDRGITPNLIAIDSESVYWQS